MSEKPTPEERAILAAWPKVTAEDIRQMNGLFPHYLFFRPGKTGTRFYASCCGRSQLLKNQRRTEFPWERELTGSLKHNEAGVCPWCGQPVTMKDLRKAGKRHMLNAYRCAVVLHGREDALYADAVVLCKPYETEEDLTAPPTFCLSSMYRFAAGDVMQADHQVWGDHGWITHERGGLGRRKFVQEPFKQGTVTWYIHKPYSILNRQSLEECPVTRYACYFSHWYPDCCLSFDFISYMTAFCMYPRQMELLVKAGLREPVQALIDTRKKFAAAMKWEEPDIRKAMGLNSSELREVLALRPPMAALELRNLAGRWCARTWTVARAAEFCRTWGEDGGRSFLRLCRRYRLDPDRLARYLEGQCVIDADLPWRDLKDVFDAYKDYLEAAWLLGWCMEHGRVLWPEELHAAHDQAAARLMECRKPAVLERAAVKRAERARKYSFELDGLRIVFPATAASIRREGEVLRHCVGGYAERHIKGVLTILFLRKADAPQTPYVTIEMDGNRMVQVHGYNNDRGRESPMILHKEFFDVWLKWLKNGSRRDKEGRPVLPKRKEARSA